MVEHRPDVAGLPGMNVGDVPLAQSAPGFWIVVGIVATSPTLPAACRFAASVSTKAEPPPRTTSPTGRAA